MDESCVSPEEFAHVQKGISKLERQLGIELAAVLELCDSLGEEFQRVKVVQKTDRKKLKKYKAEVKKWRTLEKKATSELSVLKEQMAVTEASQTAQTELWTSQLDNATGKWKAAQEKIREQTERTNLAEAEVAKYKERMEEMEQKVEESSRASKDAATMGGRLEQALDERDGLRIQLRTEKSRHAKARSELQALRQSAQSAAALAATKEQEDAVARRRLTSRLEAAKKRAKAAEEASLVSSKERASAVLRAQVAEEKLTQSSREDGSKHALQVALKEKTVLLVAAQEAEQRVAKERDQAKTSALERQKELQKKVDHAQRLVQNAETKSSQLHATHAKKMDKLRASLHAVQEQSEQSSALCRTLESELEHTKMEVGQTNEQWEAKHQQSLERQQKEHEERLGGLKRQLQQAKEMDIQRGLAHDREVQTLQHQIQSTTSSLQASEQRLEELQREMDNLQTQVKHERGRVLQGATEVSVLESQHKKQLEETRKRCQDLQKQLSQELQDRHSREQQCSVLESQVKDLHAQWTTRKKQASTLEKRVLSLATQLEEKETRIQTLLCKVKEQDKERKQQEKRHKETLQTRVKQMQVQLDARTQEIERQVALLEDHKAKASAAQEEALTSTLAAEQELYKTTEELTKQQELVEKYLNKCSGLEAMLHAQSEEMDELQTNLNKTQQLLEEQIRASAGSQSTTQAAERKVVELESNIQSMEQQMERLQEHLRGKEMALTKAHAECSSAQEHEKEAKKRCEAAEKDVHKQSKRYKKSLKEQQATVDALTKEKIALKEQQQDQMSAKEEELRLLERQRGQAQSQIKSLTASLVGKSDALEEEESRRENAELRVSELTRELVEVGEKSAVTPQPRLRKWAVKASTPASESKDSPSQLRGWAAKRKGATGAKNAIQEFYQNLPERQDRRRRERRVTMDASLEQSVDKSRPLLRDFKRVKEEWDASMDSLDDEGAPIMLSQSMPLHEEEQADMLMSSTVSDGFPVVEKKGKKVRILGPRGRRRPTRKSRSQSRLLRDGSFVLQQGLWEQGPETVDSIVYGGSTRIGIASATINRLVEKLTNLSFLKSHTEFAKVFFFVHRRFAASIIVAKKLRERWNVPHDDTLSEELALARVNEVRKGVLDALLLWIEKFGHDFHDPEVIALVAKMASFMIDQDSVKLAQALDRIRPNSLTPPESPPRITVEGETPLPTPTSHKLPRPRSVTDLVQEAKTVIESPRRSKDDDHLLHHTQSTGGLLGIAKPRMDGSISPVDPRLRKAKRRTRSRSRTLGFTFRGFNPNGDFTFDDIPEQVVAEELCLIDFALVSAIDVGCGGFGENTKAQPLEFLTLGWSKPEWQFRAPCVMAGIKQFNQLASWVAQQIVEKDKVSGRSKMLTKFVKIAEYLRKMRSFHSMTAIIAGINNAAILRLKHTHAEMRSKYRELLAELEEFVSNDNNYTSYREALALASPPGVPYLGLLCKDLVFIQDGNDDWVGTNKDMVNFDKFVMMYAAIKQVTRLTSAPYTIESIPKVYDILIELPVAEYNVIYERSLKVEPRGAEREDVF